jgi:hypothetical protein
MYMLVRYVQLNSRLSNASLEYGRQGLLVLVDLYGWLFGIEVIRSNKGHLTCQSPLQTWLPG